jgi:CheY-like chemotaxis protein/HPt (histidine-containing phosphotransfer) domain-containing protein
VSAARVLVVEDDPSIRRFIALALEDEPLELAEAASVAQALQQLRGQGPFRLVFTDLMLPDGSGLQVLQTLADEPALRAGAHVVVFSAGLSAETRQRLSALGVDEIIAKPAGVRDLLGAAQRALSAQAPAPAAPADPTQVARYFAGNQALFDAYRQSCQRQFALDRHSGDAALAAADWPALRRLAHSLKSVLQTLGHDAASAQARQLEADAAQAQPDAARRGWTQLAATLDRLAQP